MSVFTDYRGQAESVIQQAGETATVLRGQTSTNRYGSEETTYAAVGTVTVVRFYGSRNNRAEQLDVSAGRIREEAPRFAFARSADIQADDRLSFPSDPEPQTEYRVQAITRFPTHAEAQGQAVSGTAE